MANGYIGNNTGVGGRNDRGAGLDIVSAINQNHTEGAERKRIENIEKYRAELQEKNAEKLDKLDQANQKKLAEMKGKSEEEIAEQRHKLEEKYNAEYEKLQKKTEDSINAYRRELDAERRAEDLNEQLDNIKILGNAMAENGKSYGENLMNSVSSTVNTLNSSVDKYLGTYSQYMSSINARLQGAQYRTSSGEIRDLTYDELNNVMLQYTAANPYYTYEDLLKNLNSMVEQGIADNVLQRAFLQTISDEIATTFDAANGTLLQLIRIQQEDTTASRLGMEASLTEFFNSYFADTSYLNNTFDSVSAALIDASSLMGAEQAVEFEYQVQKWLGSLGSVGVSDNVLTSMASAINALASGNIDYLNRNTSLQNLLVMSTNRVEGLNYNDMLVNGVTPDEVNALMAAMIDYIQEVMSGTNNVVKNELSAIFGMTVSDVQAFQNLSSETINSISKAAMSYQDTLDELDRQLSEVSSRMHISEMIDNAMENILATTGIGIANNTVAYATYRAFDMLEGMTGGISIPWLTTFGTGIGLDMSFEGAAKSMIVGISTATSLINGALNLLTGGINGIDQWEMEAVRAGVNPYTSRGTRTTATSGITYVSSGSSEGMKESIYDEQMASAELITGMEEEEESELITIARWLQDWLETGGSRTSPLAVELVSSDVSFSNNESSTNLTA